MTKPNVTNYQQHIRLDWEGVDRKNRVGGWGGCASGMTPAKVVSVGLTGLQGCGRC